jgi:hypothetical protein
MSREEANRLSSLQREHNRKYGKDGESGSNLGKLKAMFPVNYIFNLKNFSLNLAFFIYNINCMLLNFYPFFSLN